MSVLEYRSRLLSNLRSYFDSNCVLEVVTPTVRPWGSTEPGLHNIELSVDDQTHFLQTSPEYAMKVLLADYQQSIYQICPAFRGGESGSRHRSEFLMLEWYRVGFSLLELMAETEALLREVALALDSQHTFDDVLRTSYAQLFKEHYAVDPHDASVADLSALAQAIPLQHLGDNPGRSDLLDGLFASQIEPVLTRPTMVYDYPACQAALAELHENVQGQRVANRFELFVDGMELANAYQELTDVDELVARFTVHQQVRKSAGLAMIDIDRDLLDAMQRLPRCAGIAMGVDRLAMVLMGKSSLDGVTP